MTDNDATQTRQDDADVSKELRRTLDEHGVKWKSIDFDVSKTTLFYAGSEQYIFDDGGGIASPMLAGPLTPEQVIAVTLGNETCHYIPDDTGFTWWDENDVEHCEEYSASDECYSASCDKCGYAMTVGEEGWFDGWDEITEWWEEDGSYHKGYVLTPRFKFCPNCGAKVVDE